MRAHTIKTVMVMAVLNRAIIVEDGLLEGLQENINILIEDWKREGADEVFIFPHPKGVSLNVNGIRALLQSVPNLEGAFLIGELPIARMPMDPTPGNPRDWYASDYFLMELEGNWAVDERNYVSCQNYLPPTIFLGRLVVGEDTGHILGAAKPTILEFYNQYLEKLHSFRVSSSRFSLTIDGKKVFNYPSPARNEFKAALVNNWGGDTQIIVDWIAHLYPRENIAVYEDVNKDEYLSILTDNSFDYMAFRSHSGAMQHHLEDGTEWNASDYLTVNSDVNFFELTACSTGSLVWEELSDPYDPTSPKILKLVPDLLAWNILFAQTGGLLVLAPSISGAMNHITVLYDNLREGGTFGRAFRLWAEHMNSFGDPAGWAFTLFFGDPFIRFDVPNYDCVIITSLLGTALELKLPIMRLWRNNVFMANTLGRSMVQFFYRMSPYFSMITMKSKLIRAVNRRLISGALRVLEATPLNKIVKVHMIRKTPAKISATAQRVPECESCKKSVGAQGNKKFP